MSFPYVFSYKYFIILKYKLFYELTTLVKNPQAWSFIVIFAINYGICLVFYKNYRKYPDNPLFVITEYYYKIFRDCFYWLNPKYYKKDAKWSGIL